MSYQVLARKWRPRRFQELVGQEHVVRALVNALDHQRLHHAFLFTGTRGVGKTTIARIFARCLNCHEGVSSTPCGVCPACREIDEGRFVDLIEVDAASRTGVDDTRELLENVQYAPARGRYKVYLIDEVHMFSRSSFNALLKTLEEPPPHVKFLLATTDPQRLPVTVLSRCLQFNLKRLPATLIARQLETILAQEGIEREPAALMQLARAGDGSMRDALSLLDQAIAFGGGRLTLPEVAAMLGSIDHRPIIQLVEALAANDADGLLQTIVQLDEMAPDYAGVLAELLTLLQQVALAQLVPEALDEETVTDPEAVRRLATALSPEDVQLFYQMALFGRRDLPLAPDPRGGFEMCLLRMLCFKPATLPTAIAAVSTATAERPQVYRASTYSTSSTPSIPPTQSTPSTPPPAEPGSWNSIVAALHLNGAALQLALNCVLLERQGGSWRLALAPGHRPFRVPSSEERLRAALETYCGEPVSLHIQEVDPAQATPAQQQAQQQVERRRVAAETIIRDPNVQALCETFHAQVKPDSITPSD